MVANPSRLREHGGCLTKQYEAVFRLPGCQKQIISPPVAMSDCVRNGVRGTIDGTQRSSLDCIVDP